MDSEAHSPRPSSARSFSSAHHTPASDSFGFSAHEPPEIPDYTLLRSIGHGAFGEVWLARTVMGAYRAVKIVYRDAFEHPRPFER